MCLMCVLKEIKKHKPFDLWKALCEVRQHNHVPCIFRLRDSGQRMAVKYKVSRNIIFCRINIYCLMDEKAIWLDIAQVCGHIFSENTAQEYTISTHITFSLIKYYIPL